MAGGGVVCTCFLGVRGLFHFGLHMTGKLSLFALYSSITGEQSFEI